MSNILRGIVATGASRKQAVSNYRLLARGKGVQAYAGAGNDVFLAVSAALDSFNPVTGNLDMVVAEGVLDHCDFASNSATAEVHYTVCNSCQNHIIADDASLVSHCSACGDEVEFPEGEVSESEDEDVDAAVDAADEEEPEDTGDDSEEDEDAPEADDEESEEEDDASEDEESESGDDHDFEDDDGEEDDGEEPIDLTDDDPEVPVDDEIAEAAAALNDVDLDDQLTVVAGTYEQALSAFVEMSCEDGVSQSSQLKAHYQVCHNCASHIVSENSVHECPSCSGEVDEPSQEEAEVSFDDVDLDADEDADVAEDGDEDASESEDLAILDEDGDESEDEEEPEDTGDDSEEDGEDYADDEEDEASESAASEIEIDTLADGIPADANATDLDVSFSYVQKEPMWTLYHKGQPVATATASSVGDKADLFQREAFGQAFIQSVSAGVPAHKAAADFGFRGFDLTASVSAAVSRQAQDEIASVSSAAQAQINAVQEDLMQALSTAAMGINRGFFEGVASNPLRDGLIEALASAGVGNPQVLIDRVFAGSADAYHGLLFQQAVEILRHPREVQESLSSAVQRVNMVSASAASSVHSRVGHMGTPSVQVAPPQPAVQASESSDKSKGSVFAAAMSTFG